MMNMRISLHENEPPIEAAQPAQLEAAVRRAAKEAHAEGLLSIIFLEAENGNTLSLVVGGEETSLDFVYHHKDPPYYQSKGPNKEGDPVLTAFVALLHHTEISRDRVISMEEGMSATREFFDTGELPTCIEWTEV
jgi:hypothetical protein